jgi:periplasmic divalent cation tolerance protein
MTTLRAQHPFDHALRTVIVLTTWPADRDPMALVRPLVDEHLVACVNVLPVMESVYRWQGATQRDAERQLVMKTTAVRLQALHARLCALHPYETPELLVLEVDAGAATYLDWVQASTQQPGSPDSGP